MLPSLSVFLYRIASWKTLVPLVLLYVLFPAYILKNLSSRMDALAGRPVGPIDLLFGYDPARIQQMVAGYGPEGRVVYAQGELTADIAYPVVYSLLLCIILSLLFRNRPYAPFRLVNVLPLAILLVDLVENTCIVYLLKSYPATSVAVASVCSALTNLKWAVFAVVLGLVVYGLLRLVVGRESRLQTEGS